jgi:hypothetical protein
MNERRVGKSLPDERRNSESPEKSALESLSKWFFRHTVYNREWNERRERSDISSLRLSFLPLLFLFLSRLYRSLCKVYWKVKKAEEGEEMASDIR